MLLVEYMGHVATVNKRTLPVSINKSFIATTAGNMGDQWYKTLCDLFADALSTRPGDKVFFQITGKDPTNGSLNKSDKPSNYLEVIDSEREIKGSFDDLGFIGTFEISGKPFFDDSKIKVGENAVIDSNIPIRIPINTLEFYPKPVSEDRAFNDVTDPGELWNPKFRKTLWSAKSLTSISPSEVKKLQRMIQKENDFSYDINSDDYPQDKRKEISIENRLHQDVSNVGDSLSGDITSVDLDEIPIVSDDEFKVEKVLEAWLMEMIDSDRDDMREIFGPKDDLEWFSNYVPYGMSGSNIDALAFHNKGDTRYKISVVELKKGKEKGVTEQVLNYSRWASNYLAGGDENMVQPIVIAKDFYDEDVISANKQVRERKPILVKYRIEDGEVILERKTN